MNDSPGEILFEKFRILECFKKDAHSGVYLADHIFLSKKIILKVLKTHNVEEERLVRFKKEAVIMAQLDHENIVQVLDSGIYENFFYISQEYFEGNNLRYYIDSNSLSYDEILYLVKQFYKGLAFAHSNKIIHRDLKPENIFIGKELKLKIGDFGLAYSLSENLQTAHSSIVGTPCYMAPEQIMGSESNIKSDLFSSGIVFFELLKNNNPFLGSTINESINNIANYSKLDEFEQLKKEDPVLGSVLYKLLKKSPSQRFNSAEEVLELLGEDSEPNNNEVINKKYNSTFKYVLLPVSIVIIAIMFYMLFTDKNDIEKTENKPETGNDTSETTMDKELKRDTVFVEKTDINDKTEIPENNKNSTGNVNTERSFSEVEESGYIDIECHPWANLLINEKDYGSTPLDENVELKSGEYDVTLKHPKYPEYKTTVTVEPGKTVNLRVNLDTLVGYVNFNVLPWGEVFIDNKSEGVTPFTKPIMLIPGKHEIKIKNPGYSNLEFSINVTPGDTLQQKHKFK